MNCPVEHATTPSGRLEHHFLEGEAVTFYPYWAADLRNVLGIDDPPVIVMELVDGVYVEVNP